jgi:acyl-coenzyme A synthetase/AMP-(fatty) acid ligase
VFEFAGRVDDQVKIRGIRVELGDIEAALLDHPSVRSAAVVCSDTPSGKRLTAYVVPRGSTPVPAPDLRAFVRDRIPPALIPNRFESIASLPLTPSGKLDRRSLPTLLADPRMRSGRQWNVPFAPTDRAHTPAPLRCFVPWIAA